MAELVTTETRDGIAVLTLDNPPVNALSAPLRAAIVAALRAASADPAVRGIVLAAKGKAWIAGADISEFGKPPVPPTTPEVIAALEACPKPVVAAIHGVALGGGLEVALGCHARVGGPEARLGLPEVKLGLIPGAGGTQRAPRLMGAAAALELMISGEPLRPDDALRAGLLDRVAGADVVAEAAALARDLAAALPPPVLAREEKLHEPGAREAFEAAAAKHAKRAAEEPQVAAIVQSVRNAFDLPASEALARERALFLALTQDPRSKALRHLFFAEREAAKVAVPPGTKPRPVARAAVLGAGTMGAGIAICFANAGIPVTVIETDEAALARGLSRIADTYAASVKRGSLTEAAKAERLARIEGRVGPEAAADADLIVEAVFEDMGVKREVFGRLAAVAKPGAVLATNTSYLDVNGIAAAAGDRAADVLGMHFFSPANVMRLLEVVRAARTAPDALLTAVEVGKRLGKLPVTVGVCFGFVGNRMLFRRTLEADRLLLEGASPQQLDSALTGFGFRMGPCAMADLAGLDISWRVRKQFGIEAPAFDALAEAGRLGQKTGRGFYAYPEGARAGEPDPEAEEMIAKVAAARGIARRSHTPEEIRDRLLLPMINEGARILEEGIAARASDIDVVWVHGYGWPAWTGGPMHYADARGLKEIAERLSAFAEATGDAALRPAPLLARLAAEGRGFGG
ncbi:MAG: 3-hydroxyacyl-CoA dehydrogenase NAD-binding domain-containing protein [Acetobacteraceae bacterium]|nr:3-hydroxyacyl-CoA dehydrogenase NAD-binding domain-containing protein [Acetobacteraceae bacterium]